MTIIKFSRYEIAAFITGFALLAYELSAARILAPTIGSSTYVWTSVIGVIIAALSLGYAIGGILADRRTKSSDIGVLLLASATTTLISIILSRDALEVIASLVRDPRLQGLIASAFLFSPTSFLLGAVSPYLAKLRTVSLKHTGTSIASLSAANAVGGIVGTFSVGFIFFRIFWI